MTVVELGDALTKRHIYRHLKPVFDQGAGTLIKPLTWQGDMSFGPPRDGQHTFQRLDANPRWRGIPDVDDAGPRAILAYLRTYGPATLDHVHYWLGNGLSAGRARLNNWFSGLGDRLVAVDVEGTAAYVVPHGTRRVDPLELVTHLYATPTQALARQAYLCAANSDGWWSSLESTDLASQL